MVKYEERGRGKRWVSGEAGKIFRDEEWRKEGKGKERKRRDASDTSYESNCRSLRQF